MKLTPNHQRRPAFNYLEAVENIHGRQGLLATVWTLPNGYTYTVYRNSVLVYYSHKSYPVRATAHKRATDRLRKMESE